MKTLPFLIIIAAALTSCSGDPVEPNNESGRLMSITSYGLGDSATTTVQYQKFTFKYDNDNRVSEILLNSNNLTTSSAGTIRFYYQGSSNQPFLMIDSAIGSGATYSVIKKTFFYYDGANRKEKDSAFQYVRYHNDLSTIQQMTPLNQHWVNVYTYTPAYVTKQVTRGLGSGLYIDSFYYGSNNDFKRARSGISYTDSIVLDYYTEANPQAELNISKALVAVYDYWGLSFHPATYDLNKAIHLPKSIYCRHYEASNNQTFNLDYYYSKNTADKIGKVVVAKRRRYWPSNNLFDFYYMTYIFDYYP